jgi:transcriptional regulator with XRE-family HTH domain
MVKVTTNFKKPRPRYFFREWRKYRNLTQEDLASRIGVSAPAISQLERGVQGFTNSTLEALADALSCEPGDLLSVNPFKDGEVVDLMRLINEKNRDQAIRVLRALAAG